MAIQFAKLVQKTFSHENGTFHLYRMRCTGGEWASAVYIGEDPPPARKTVEYQLTGEWVNHPKHGRQFNIQRYQRAIKKQDGFEDVVIARKHQEL